MAANEDSNSDDSQARGDRHAMQDRQDNGDGLSVFNNSVTVKHVYIERKNVIIPFIKTCMIKHTCTLIMHLNI